MRCLRTATFLLATSFLLADAATVVAGNSRTTISVRLDDTKPSGLAWDSGHPIPDPYVVVDGKNFRSKRCEDNYSCSWTLASTDEYYDVAVYDADMMDDDYAGTVRCRRGQVCDTGQGATVTIY